MLNTPDDQKCSVATDSPNSTYWVATTWDALLKPAPPPRRVELAVSYTEFFLQTFATFSHFIPEADKLNSAFFFNLVLRYAPGEK